jgi:hypothetical protein
MKSSTTVVGLVVFIIGLIAAIMLPGGGQPWGAGANPPYTPHSRFVDCKGYQRERQACKASEVYP